ncbi:MAG: glutathione S-transferase family protein [Nevskiaceae bacterium]
MGKVKLYTYSASQASEKVRWALEASAIRYREIRLTPFAHAGELFQSMPMLAADGDNITDSTRILEWLEVHRAPFRLIPRDPLVRTAVMEAEARFDQAGIHLLRWVYAGLLQDRSLALSLWTLDANIAQWGALSIGFPLIRRFLAKGIGFDLRSMGRSRRIIDRTLAELDALATAGRAYVVGDSLTVADVTAAALFSPLACPDEHAIYGAPGWQQAMQATLRHWQDRPGLEWVRSMYWRHREWLPAPACAAPAPATDPVAMPEAA